MHQRTPKKRKQWLVFPIGKEIKKLMNDETYLHGILNKGGEKARVIAEENLKNIRDIVGLI